jgi:hypothetical protein
MTQDGVTDSPRNQIRNPIKTLEENIPMPKPTQNIAQIAAAAAAAIATTETITAEAPTSNVVPIVAPVAKTAKKQYFVGCSEDRKVEIQALAEQYTGPGVTKSYPMTEKEAVDLLWHVATNRRFESVQAIDEEGLPSYDTDGQPAMEVTDHFDLEVKRIFSLRDTAPEKGNTKESLMAQMARIQAKLKALGLVAG